MSEVRVHEFLPDGEVSEWDGTPSCTACPLPKGHAVHVVEVSDGAAEIDARMLGEHEADL